MHEKYVLQQGIIYIIDIEHIKFKYDVILCSNFALSSNFCVPNFESDMVLYVYICIIGSLNQTISNNTQK